MKIGLLKDMVHTRPQGERLLGLDVGKKTIGVALSDPSHSIATPLQTIQRTKFSKDMEVLAKIVAEFEVKGFVLGYPLNMDGSVGPRCQSVRDFAAEMIRFPAVVGPHPWVAFWDERLSTVSADNLVDELVEKRKTRVNAKSSGLIDKLAARSILQGALEFIAQH
jgi:putative Holliday junction resolvase